MHKSYSYIVTLGSGILLVFGLVAAFSGLFSYLTRYANLDSLDGVIDDAVYEQITQMFTQEKVFLFGGIMLAIVGTIGMALGMAAGSRASKVHD